MFKLKRIGKSGQPSFRVIVIEKRSKINGRYLEDLGWLNPFSKAYELNKERAVYWLAKGVKPSSVLHNLFLRAKIISGSKIPVHKKALKPKEEKTAAPETKAEAKS